LKNSYHDYKNNNRRKQVMYLMQSILMLISLLISLLVSNAVTLRRDKSILFSRIVITGLFFASFLALNNLFTKALEKGIGIYGGLFNVTTLIQ